MIFYLRILIFSPVSLRCMAPWQEAIDIGKKSSSIRIISFFASESTQHFFPSPSRDHEMVSSYLGLTSEDFRK